jgi:DNA mismatch repair protein MutS2
MNERCLRVLEFAKTREIVASFSRTDLGQAHIRSLEPVQDRAAVERIFDLTDDFTVFLSEHKFPAYSLHDISPHLASAAIPDFVLTRADLWSVCLTLRNILRFRETFREETLPHRSLSGLAKDLRQTKELMTGFGKTFDDSGEIRDDATDELFRIRTAVRDTRKRIQKLLNGLLDSRTFVGCLENRELVRYDDRFVVLLKGQFKNKIRGIVHGTSNSGLTAYFEPDDFVPENNTLSELASAEEDEVYRILFGLSEMVRGFLPDIRHNLEIARLFEQAAANHGYGQAHAAVRPVFGDEGLDLRRARHPLIPGCVPVDIGLKPPHRCLVISGPNTGGKTAALKTAGLLCLMARSGLPIPALAGSCLPFCEEIFIDLGDEQSLEQSLSTFSAHLLNLKAILEHAGQKSLVLIDEPGVGTEPEFGEVFAVTLLQELKDRGPLSLVTTHYKRVKLLGLDDPWFLNASVDFDPESFAPRYSLLYNIPGDSQPLAVMRRLGFPPRVLARAEANHRKESLDLSATIIGLTAEKRRLEAERRDWESKNAEYGALLDTYEKKFEEVSAKEKKLKKDYRLRIREFLAEARKNFELIVRKIVESGRSKESLREARDLFDSLEIQADGLEEKLESALQPAETVGIGDTVAVKGQHYHGRVKAVRDGKAVLVTELGNVTVDLDLLTKVQDVPKPAPQFASRTPHGAQAPKTERTFVRDSRTTLDLRGMYQHEALPRLEEFFDQAVLSRLPYLNIIHGKGTGKLKEMTREFFARKLKAREIRSWAPAPHEQGGDGCTIAEL